MENKDRIFEAINRELDKELEEEVEELRKEVDKIITAYEPLVNVLRETVDAHPEVWTEGFARAFARVEAVLDYAKRVKAEMEKEDKSELYRLLGVDDERE